MNKLQTLPASPDDITLGQWLGFIRLYGKDLDAKREAIDEMPESMQKEFDKADHSLDRMYCLVAWFTNVPLDEAELLYSVEEVSTAYQDRLSMILEIDEVELQDEYLFNGEMWQLPPVELVPGSKLTFGEFIDSKVVLQNAKVTKQNKWELLHQVAAIFFRMKGEVYTDLFIFDDSDRLKLLEALPMTIVLHVGYWFEQFNEFLSTHYTIFHPSNIKSGRNMAKHFEMWGWVNFLASIAKTKIFDIPSSGLNSIECARLAPCTDVLTYAGQEKAYNEAYVADMDKK